MYQYVRPAKVLAALEWLKENNPLYLDITINSDWQADAAEDDADLWEAFSSQHKQQQQPAATAPKKCKYYMLVNNMHYANQHT